MSFDIEWPWIGIAVAAVLLVLLFFTRIFSTPDIASRWHDPRWLAVLGLPIYIAHQFEEHGVDLKGVRYAFRGALCGFLGYQDAVTCPIPLSFITAVNVGSVWGAFVLAAMFGRRRPVIALSAYGIPLINAFSHIGGALREQAYNPGLLTAVLLFLPASAWVLRVGRRAGIGWRGVVAIVLGGVLTHVVLMGSLLAFLHGYIGAPTLVAIQIVDMVVPLMLALVASNPARVPVGLKTNSS